MINPDTTYDGENKSWRESQIQHLSKLREDLVSAQDQESVDTAARALADHMINL